MEWRRAGAEEAGVRRWSDVRAVRYRFPVCEVFGVSRPGRLIGIRRRCVEFGR